MHISTHTKVFTYLHVCNLQIVRVLQNCVSNTNWVLDLIMNYLQTELFYKSKIHPNLKIRIMKKALLIAVILSYLASLSLGQNAEIDSLKNVIRTTQSDSVKLITYLLLNDRIKFNHPDTNTQIYNEAIQFAKTKKNKMTIAGLYNNRAISFGVYGQNNCQNAGGSDYYTGGVVKARINSHNTSYNTVTFGIKKCDGGLFGSGGKAVIYDATEGVPICVNYSSGVYSVDVEVGTTLFEGGNSF